MLATILLTLGLAVWLFFAVRSMVRAARKGECPGGCGGCNGCSACKGCGSCREQQSQGCNLSEKTV